MKPRIIYIHGNGTTDWRFGWAPWLQVELESRGYETCFETFPDGVKARSTYWLPHLENEIHAGENDVLVGWSSGAVAAMRYAETHRIKGSVLIAPCYTDLGLDSEKESGYYDTPWGWEAIRSHQGPIALFHSNDPYIPQEEFDVITEALQAKRFSLSDAGHFTKQDVFPELLAYLTETYPL